MLHTNPVARAVSLVSLFATLIDLCLFKAPGNYSTDILNVAMFRLKIDKSGRGNIGDSAIVRLDINSAAINYHDAFT